MPTKDHTVLAGVNVSVATWCRGRFSGVHQWPVLGVHRGWPAVVHLDISVLHVKHYQVDGTTPSTLDHVTNAAKYLPTLRERLSDLSDTEIDVVIYNAGVDPHQHCDIGGLAGITNAILAERERMVFEWARARLAPVAFVLAGGHVGGSLQQDTLLELHRLTVAAAASSRPLASG